MRASSYGNIQLARRVLVVNLAQNRLRQIDAVDPPAPLRRHIRRRIIEILVICFQEAVVDFVKLVIEDLLWGFISVWSRIRSEENAVLVALKKSVWR